MVANGEALDEEVMALIRRRLGNSIGLLRVVRRDGGLVLQGRVFSYYAKQVALEAARQVRNLPIVDNKIEVRTGPCPDDLNR